MKVVVACDSYKGSLSSVDAAKSIERGLLKYNEDLNVVKVPMADGGEGTVEALVESTGGHYERIIVRDPLFREIEAIYGVSGDGETAYIEMAEASGLTLLSDEEKNPYVTSSYGTGQLICDALHKGCKKIIIGLGGSATNDGGAGMLRALGVRFLDSNNNELKEGGIFLSKLCAIRTENIMPSLKECDIRIACDVDNPLTGINGASYIFGPQKGASEEMVAKLDQALFHYAKIIQKTTGVDVRDIQGAGAAGGIGGGFLGLTNGRLEKGVDIIIAETKLEEHLKDAQLVITGEGKIDYQTRFGKTPYGVAKKAKEFDIPVIAIECAIGENTDSLYDHGFDAIFSIADRPMTLKESMEGCDKLLENIAHRIIRTFMLREDNKL